MQSRLGLRSVFRKQNTTTDSVVMAKIAVGIAAFVIAVAIFLLFIYEIIPSVISNMSEKIDMDYALNLYQRTVNDTQPEPKEAEVFEQKDTRLRFPRDCFASVRGENPDIVGRISIEPLDIGYLVTQSTDNNFYLKHGYDRKESKSGTIFLDYRCNAEAQPLQGHYILYGHNMKNGSMFHSLSQYEDAAFFSENRRIRFDTLYEDYEWEVFSAYVTDTKFYYIDTTFKDDAEWLDFLHEIQQKSLHQTDTRLSADDVVLTLSTCNYSFKNARFVVHARLVDEL